MVRAARRSTAIGSRSCVGQAGTGKTVALARRARGVGGERHAGPRRGGRASRRARARATAPASSRRASPRCCAGCALGADRCRAARCWWSTRRACCRRASSPSCSATSSAADGKLVLTGDHRQLPELEAGGCFRGLVDRLPAIGLGDNRRQHARWERAALRELRHGDVDTALAEYQRTAACSPRTTRRRCVRGSWPTGGRAAEPDGGIMIALRRRDVRALNRLARRRCVDAGRVRGPRCSLRASRSRRATWSSSGTTTVARAWPTAIAASSRRRRRSPGRRASAAAASTLDREYLVADDRARRSGRRARLRGHRPRRAGPDGPRGIRARDRRDLPRMGLHGDEPRDGANRLYMVDGEPSIRDEIAPAGSPRRRRGVGRLAAPVQAAVDGARPRNAGRSGTAPGRRRASASEVKARLAMAAEGKKRLWRRRSDARRPRCGAAGAARAAASPSCDEEEAAIRRDVRASRSTQPAADVALRDQPERSAERPAERAIRR